MRILEDIIGTLPTYTLTVNNTTTINPSKSAVYRTSGLIYYINNDDEQSRVVSTILCFSKSDTTAILMGILATEGSFLWADYSAGTTLSNVNWSTINPFVIDLR